MRKLLLAVIAVVCMSIMQLHAQQLFVGSYNIRYQNESDARQGNGWDKRLPVLCAQVNFEHPDIFGVQEALEPQLNDMLSRLPDYAYIGRGRDDGIHAGEHEAIFYDVSRLELLDHGDFWLSETPEKPGLGWDAACVRICTWGKFEDRKALKTFYFFNLHMDHVGVVARREAAKLVVERIRLIAGNQPVILTGDFNVDQNDEIYQTFTRSGLLKDSYDHAQYRFAENGTFNSYDPDLKTESRIDHVFVSPRFQVDRYGVLTNGYWVPTEQSSEQLKASNAPQQINFSKHQRRLPSDHYPVFVHLNWSAWQDRVVVAYVTAGKNDVPDPNVMTHINYAFGTVNETFNGVNIQDPDRLRMIVGLKQQNPKLKVLLSIGGWTAGRFSEMAATKETRDAFARDCKRIVDEFGLDGIDMDWEYPSSSEAGISSSPDDIDNFTLLMKELRRVLGQDKLLTIATICTAKYIDFKNCLPYLDLVNVMSYDMSDPNKQHHAALYPSPISGYCTASEAVEAHLKAGVPKDKLVMGMPFYGKGRRQDKGVDEYLRTGVLPKGYTRQWSDEAKAEYIANKNGEFVWAYETVRSLTEKCQYILDNNLRGGMYWEYSEDKTGEFTKVLSDMILQNAQTNIGQKTQSLESSAWEHSEWISAANAPVVSGRADQVVRAADGASWFVTDIRNEQKVTSAKWMTAGLGVYELYLNGAPVGEEILKPGFTHYAKTKRSFTYDVTAAFNKEKGAKNQLSAQVTPGWWGDKIVTPGNTEGMIGKKCAFRGVLELTFADGTKKYYGTNCDDWKAGIAGPVKHAGIFDGEAYDARELPGYATVDKLSRPEPNTEFKGEILPSEGAEVYLRQDLALKPERIYVWKGISGEKQAEEKKKVEYGKVIIQRNYADGETITLQPGETLVVDFGQNCSAVPAFSFKAKAGTLLTCLPAEILNDGNGAESRGMDGPEGSVHRRNLRIQDKCMRLDYTFDDSRDFVDYHPHCTFFGYRFISVTATDQVEIRKIESLPITSIAKTLETGTITTGHELVNRIISNTIWGQRSNYLSVPTDCPQRDERLGWMADTQVFAGAGSFFANTDRFFHKWTRDVRDSQSETGGFPGVAPTSQYGNEMMRLGWADAGVIVPWTVWKQFGDPSIIDENWEAMTRFMNHVNETKYDHTLLAGENHNYQWADWLSYEPLESCLNLAFDKNWKPLPDAISYWNYLSACFWLMDAEMMRDMAQATRRDVTRYQQMANTARAYLKEQFFDGNGNFKTEVLNTMQTPALFALKNQLVEGQAKERTIQRLRDNIAAHDNCLQTGFLGTAILMGTLTENGMSDIAYELLFQRKNPSWIYSIDNGATTIWERWNSYRQDKGLGPNGMNSFNHYAYGAVCEWIWETVAGIASDIKEPGFKHIIMKPIPDQRLGFVNAELKSAAGLIKSSWKYEGAKWIWDFTIPEGATATVTLPGETTSKEYQSGTYQIVKNAE